MLRDLGHRAIGRQVALQDDQAAFSPKRAGQRRDDLLAGGLLDRLALLAEGAPGDGQRVAVDVAAIDQTLRQDGDPSGSVQLDRSKTSTGLEVAQQRSTAADAIDIVDREVDADLARQGEQVKHRVGRATACGDRGDRVVEGAARQDLRRPPIGREHVERELAHPLRGPVLLGIHLRDGVEAHGREADHLHQHRHRVRRVLAAARARTRTSDGLELGEVGVGDLARGRRADRLVDVAHRDLLAAPRAGHDRAAI